MTAATFRSKTRHFIPAPPPFNPGPSDIPPNNEQIAMLLQEVQEQLERIILQLQSTQETNCDD